MQVHVLASGSDGNATVVTSGNEAILLDAGLGPRQLKQRLGILGLDFSDLQACFLTHEHIDHISGLQRKSFPDIPIFANRPTAIAASRTFIGATGYSWQEQPVGSTVQIGSLTIESYATSHDAASSVGYFISDGTENLLFATDLGTPSDSICEAIADADYIVLEANHDEQMLREGPYPYYLKRRVASNQGHLSNRQTATLLALTLSQRTRWLALAHLSRTNNIPNLALHTVCATLDAMGQLHSGLRVVAAPALASGLAPISSASE